jgi:hypothetical protein
VYSNITDGFSVHSQRAESREYAAFFRRWVDEGRRLDIVLNLHNLESADGGHIYCALIEPSRERGDLSLQLHSRTLAMVQKAGFDIDAAVRNRGFFSSRLGGWLLAYYGPLHLLYEVNSQSPRRHLLPDELRAMGRAIAQSAGIDWVGTTGRQITAAVDGKRSGRRVAVAAAGEDVAYGQSAIRYEYDVLLRLPPNQQGLIDPELLK